MGTVRANANDNTTVRKGDGVMFESCGPLGTRVSLDAVSSGDGTTTTLLFAEKNGNNQAPKLRWSAMEASPMADANTNTSSGSFPNAIPRSTAGAAQFAFLHVGNGTGPTQPLKPPAANPQLYASANHGGGVIVAFCDGHTKLISDTINYQIYAQLMTQDGTASSWALPNGLDSLPPLNEGAF